MSRKYVVLRLTLLEAKNLAHAAGYSLEWPQFLDPFGEGKPDEPRDRREFDAAWRGLSKLNKAIRAVAPSPGSTPQKGESA